MSKIINPPLLAANNLSDLTSASTARVNLGSIPFWTKVTVTYSQLATAGLTNTVSLLTLPIKGVLQDVKVSVSTVFSGGTIATYTLSVGIAGSLLKYHPIIDAKTAVILTTPAAPVSGLESVSGTTSIVLSAVSTVGNLNAATQGSVDVWLLTSTLP